MAISSPSITIITVNYNDADALEQTIQSVVNQDYRNIEYIIIDGGSIDNSIPIIKKQESHIAKWKSESDTGIYQAMNKGIQLATGEWICFLNSGDVFVDNKSVEKVAEEINLTDEKPDIIYGNILIQNTGGTHREKMAKEPCNLHRMFFCHQSAFVKTAVLRKYSFDERYKMSADLKFFKQCYQDKYTFKHLNVPLIIYSMSGISNTQREKGLRENMAVIREMDKGCEKLLFLSRIYFVIYWRKLIRKAKKQ